MPSAIMPVQRASARPYRDFLTPALHRRFTNAALLTISVCYLEACWMGEWDLFWQWFPFGLAGLRALILFISALSIYVLRVAQLHFGRRTAVSEFGQVKSSIISLGAVQTFAWYSLSAWLFSEVYIWSAGPSALMGVVDEGRPDEPPRLNERPIYVRSIMLCVAAAQSVLHIYKDYDQVRIPASKVRSQPADSTASVQGMVPTIVKLQKALPNLLQVALFRSVVVSLTGPIVYMMFLRQTVWYYTFRFARAFYRLPKESRPGTLPPFMVDLMGRVLVEAFLLLFLWEFCNCSFAILVAQEPLKKDKLLTDGSKDPNGSLLAGLKSKKEVPRTMAFWELVLVANHYPIRRKSIFLELDRKGGSTFSQLLTICLGELHAAVKRVHDFQNPSAQPVLPAAAEIHTLPKVSQPLKVGNVFTATPPRRSGYEKFQSEVGAFAKAHGQSPKAELEAPLATKLLTFGERSPLSKAHLEKLNAGAAKSAVQQYAVEILRTPVGQPFRITLARRLDSVVLGSPVSHLGTILDAIAAISQLAVCSLKEDSYGKAYHDIPNIIRTFVSTATTLQGFAQTASPHWSDVNLQVQGHDDRQTRDIQQIIDGLRAGLRNLLNEFGEYADDLGLSRAEMRNAKEVVAAAAKS